MNVVALFRAPQGASSGEIRRLGLRSLGIGSLLFVPGIVLFVVARGWLLDTFGTPGPGGTSVVIPHQVALAIGGPMIAGYCLVMIGLARVLFGAAAESKSVLMGLVRVAFGVLATISFVALAIVVAATVARG